MMMRWVLAVLVLLVMGGVVAADDTWTSDSDIVSGLGDVGEYSTPEVFQKGSNWYLISGEIGGTFDGYNWTGSAWQSDSAIAGGLSGVGVYTTLTVAAVAIGHLDILVMISCGAVVVWVTRSRRRGAGA